jgi:hypothetical protein
MTHPEVATNAWERLVGPGATRAETAGTIAAGVVGAAVATWRAVAVDADLLAVAVAALVALDVVGGVWANATETTRSWYHRPGSSGRSQLRFAGLHVHPFVLAALFAGLSWGSASILYVGVLAATAVIVTAPRALANSIALVAVLALLVGVAVLDGAVPGLEWFPAAYLLKLLAGHAVPPRGTP